MDSPLGIVGRLSSAFAASGKRADAQITAVMKVLCIELQFILSFSIFAGPMTAAGLHLLILQEPVQSETPRTPGGVRHLYKDETFAERLFSWVVYAPTGP